jgi:hypothetical protein
LWALLLSAVIACFAPAAVTSALDRPHPLVSGRAAAQAQTAPQHDENGVETRYHGELEGQYQPQAKWRQARAAAPPAHAAQQASAAAPRPWKQLPKFGRRYSNREYVKRITASLISPRRFNPDSAVSSAVEKRLHRALPISQIAARTRHSISPWVSHANRRRLASTSTQGTGAVAVSGTPPSQQGRETRLMLQIGQFLGLVYLAFLALWFWATRLRTKPHRRARI